MSDEDLIFLINRGSMLAEHVFYERYSKIAHSVANSYYQEFKDSGISLEDFYAVVFAKTYYVVKNYKKKKKPFYSYWKAAVRNAVYDYVKSNSYRLGAKALGDISLDEERYVENESLLFQDVLGENDEKPMTITEILDEAVYGDSSYLKPDQKLVAHYLFFKQLKPSEILEETHWTRAKLSYVIRSTKAKIQELLKDNYL